MPVVLLMEFFKTQKICEKRDNYCILNVYYLLSNFITHFLNFWIFIFIRNYKKYNR